MWTGLQLFQVLRAELEIYLLLGKSRAITCEPLQCNSPIFQHLISLYGATILYRFQVLRSGV